ncbi:MAG TPA: SDR family NAD(P)-dependent oxidoreductase [Alphaproteobacteria bacterium]|jgi:hypothetical protein|nr:SDR family NAD(P)-dependent oxidoreductase [Alphaproteobacteria bacterium]MDP6272132.1 SDR family NAD(P)-dependent oxidoreductase [Alphaproteobacteria bacterium]MDP7164827.1 SDR family NAD(P)-dependent oxidoreductase [Alphaproteobacteria bacterium]MDP7427566.1 SDR family NAD(P)-dependent oxidoreductase [Alphaproteobacteria bacterium]HJM51940.1 SDR family NAD(P)-dependent oxidoreductase [Alphaproteobacteria bacterium]
MTYQAFDLSGKVALVTGGNGGIGLGMAEAAAQAGADVCIWGRNEEKNAAAVAQLEAAGAKALALPVDVVDQAAVKDGMARTIAEFGRIDACFANAGASTRGKTILDITAEEWHRIISVNLDGAFYTMQAAAAHMAERAQAGDPGGRIIGTASLAAVSGAPGNEHYAATKGGLISMIRAMAVGLARYGVTVNAVLPGWIETAMTADAFAWKKFEDAVLPRIPMRRWGKPEDFGAIAVYIMSDASAYHTGETFMIDGGYFLF